MTEKKIKKKTNCTMCGEETIYDNKFNKYFCKKCIYAGNEANITMEEE